MDEMGKGADQINIAVNNVHTLSGRNKENIGILVKEVSRFKIDDAKPGAFLRRKQ
jgi:methyl-accepting chemotaxis protein